MSNPLNGIISPSGGGGGGAGVSGLTTADGGNAIADNEIIRGDGTTGIQGSTITIDDNGTITIPSAEAIEWSTDTGLARSAAGVVKVTNGSSGTGGLITTSVDSGAAANLNLKYNGSSKIQIATSSVTIFDLMDGNGNKIQNFARVVEANTAGVGSPNVLASNSDGMKLLTNEGSTAKNYHTLPAASGGYSFRGTFYVQDADGMRITAGSGDTIRVLDKVTAAAGYIESTTIGSYVTIQDINADEWVVIGIGGVWTDGTFTFDNTGLTSP